MYEFLFSKVLYPAYETHLCRRGTLRYLAEYEANARKSFDELSAIQLEKLRALLRHAHEHVPYYRRTWQRLGFDPGDVRELSDFEKLPTIGKDTIRENYDDFIAGNYRGCTMSKATGGTTGEPFRLEFTEESYQRRMAVVYRGYAWAGARLGCRSVHLWSGQVGEPGRARIMKERAYHRLFNRRMLNSFRMSPEDMSRYVREINRFRPEVIVSFTTPLHQLAEFIEARRLSVFRPQAILTGAEPLFEHQRAFIERVFGSPVYNTYGCREVTLIANETPARDGLRINIDHLVVETLVDNENVHGVVGDIALTDLHNYGMPLIRYLNGDLGIRQATPPVGSPFPVLTSVEGRRLDAIRIPSGGTLPGEFFPHMLKDVAGVRRFQVVQDALEQLTINLVTDEQFNRGRLEYVKSEVEKVLGDKLSVEFRMVDDIPLTRAGKHRVTICNVDR